jgi:hypothetical protein
LEERRKTVEKLKKSIEDGSLDASTDWVEIPAAERRSTAKQFVEQFEGENTATASRLPEGNDAAAALEWSRRELEKWEEEHFPGLWRASGGQLGSLDIYGHAEGLSISVRSAIGRCLLAKGDTRAAVRVLKPCVAGRYYHGACISPLVEAGVALVRSGALPEAVAIYKLVSPSVVSTDPLFNVIETAAPGAVERRTLVSRPPVLRENP